MSDPELARRAAAAGIATSYRNWRGDVVAVSDQTLEAVLTALGPVPQLARPAVPALRRQARPRVPDQRCWGFVLQLYALRSGQSWGHGDFRDLADFARCSAAELGADFVQVNPLYAAEPLPPVSPSPYLPMTRRYLSPLYLRLSDIPEYAMLGPERTARVERLAAPLRARNGTAELIDRDAVWSAKLAALELIRRVPLSPQRQEAFARFQATEGENLARWAAWCALAEVHGPDWRHWPARLRAPSAALAATRSGPLTRRAEFGSWLQWLASEQLAEAQRVALAAGLRIGIVSDLPVGSHPGGADAWANQGLLVPGLRVGAPPDGFNQRGQDWGLPAWHPQRLADEGYGPLSELFGAALRHGGGLRVDHVMALMRLWLIPDGMSPDQGTYVSSDLQAGLAALADAAGRRAAVAIGEDLGTVAPGFREQLAAAGVLGTTMAWFAREPDGTPLRPRHWRRLCLATVGTHDMPTVTGFLTGEQVAVRERLGLLTRPAEAERAAAKQMLRQWLAVLSDENILAADSWPTAAELTVALHRMLAATPAILIGVSLADAVGDLRAQNIPGTTDEYPNWRIPLCDADGKALQLEDLAATDLLRAVTQAVSRPPGQRPSTQNTTLPPAGWKK